MLALALALLVHAEPELPVQVTSSAAYERKPRMVVLFRRYDGFFPVACAVRGTLRAGHACVEVMPRAPVVRRMSGARVTLKPLARLPVSAWDAAPQRGWALPDGDGGEHGFDHTELAVWPADANPGFEPPPVSTVTVDLEGLQALPKREGEASLAKKRSVREAEEAWPPKVEQVIELGARGTAVVLSGARRGLFLKAPDGWHALRTQSAAEVGTSVVGRMDLDGDGRVEWLVFIRGWNEFGFEVWTSDFGKVLFSFNDCGV